MTFMMLLLSAGVGQVPPTVAPPPKLVCKRIVETGSIVGRRKICYTKAEWDNIAAAARTTSEQLQANNMGRPEGN